MRSTGGTVRFRRRNAPIIYLHLITHLEPLTASVWDRARHADRHPQVKCQHRQQDRQTREGHDPQALCANCNTSESMVPHSGVGAAPPCRGNQEQPYREWR